MTGVSRTTPNGEEVEIQFYFEEGGTVLPAQQVQTVLKKLPLSTMDSEIGYPVSQRIVYTLLIVEIHFQYFSFQHFFPNKAFFLRKCFCAKLESWKCSKKKID